MRDAFKDGEGGGVDTAVETGGKCADGKRFEAVMPYVDNVLYDIKTLCPEDHFKYCGADNVRILRNLRRLDSGGASIHIRIPVVPGVNGDRKSIGDILRGLAAMDNIKTVSLLPFHSLGANKYRMLGRAYGIDGTTPPNKETMEELEGSWRDGTMNAFVKNIRR
jgi:pyruvate formate lyase activating enzyme